MQGRRELKDTPTIPRLAATRKVLPVLIELNLWNFWKLLGAEIVFGHKGNRIESSNRFLKVF